MKIQTVVDQRDALIQQLKSLIPAEKFAQISEDLRHVCDLSFEAGRTLDAERAALFKAE